MNFVDALGLKPGNRFDVNPAKSEVSRLESSPREARSLDELLAILTADNLH